MSYAIACFIALKEENNIYKDHPEFKLPLNENEKIWRYLDFTKFVSLICNQSLFFCRADEIAKLDRFEGTFTGASLKALISKTNTKKPEDEFETLKQMFGLLTRALRKCTVVSCWHKSEIESDAMWKLYSSNKQSIAIQSTIGRLKSCFDKTKERIWIGEVEYIDFEIIKKVISSLQDRIEILKKMYNRFLEDENSNINNQNFLKGYLMAYENLIKNLNDEKNSLIEKYQSKIDIYA